MEEIRVRITFCRAAKRKLILQETGRSVRRFYQILDPLPALGLFPSSGGLLEGEDATDELLEGNDAAHQHVPGDAEVARAVTHVAVDVQFPARDDPDRKADDRRPQPRLDVMASLSQCLQGAVDRALRSGRFDGAVRAHSEVEVFGDLLGIFLRTLFGVVAVRRALI